jgi:hypothetical protein
MIALDPGTITMIQGVGYAIWESGSFQVAWQVGLEPDPWCFSFGYIGLP